MTLSSRKDRVTLSDLVLAEVILAGEHGASTVSLHESVVVSAQRDDLNLFRTSRILSGLQRRGLVNISKNGVRPNERVWSVSKAGLDRAESWHP